MLFALYLLPLIVTKYCLDKMKVLVALLIIPGALGARFGLLRVGPTEPFVQSSREFGRAALEKDASA